MQLTHIVSEKLDIADLVKYNNDTSFLVYKPHHKLYNANISKRFIRGTTVPSLPIPNQKLIYLTLFPF